MKLRRLVNTSLLILICSLLTVAFSQSSARNYALSGDFCYIVDQTRPAIDNMYFSFVADVELYKYEPLSFVVSSSPRLIYGVRDGLDFSVSVSVQIGIFTTGGSHQIRGGTLFPSNFLNDCNLFMRVNLNQDTF